MNEPENAPREKRATLPESILRGPIDIRSASLTGLLVLALFYTLYLAREFLLPVFVSILVAIVLTKPVELLARLSIPRPLASLMVVGGLLAILVLGLFQIATPLQSWLQTLPQNARQMERSLEGLLNPVEEIQEAAAKVEEMASLGKEKRQEVEVREPSLADLVLSSTREFMAALAVVCALVFFLLSNNDFFLRKLVRVLPRLQEKKRAVDVARNIQGSIARYLMTITLINIALGACVGLALWLLGLPNPQLWGAMATLFNFIPYLGAAVGIGVVGLVSLSTLETVQAALLPPIAYAILTVVEGTFITPMVLGRRLSLNPVVILLGLLFWGWLWGIPGALLAVPILASLKIVCDSVPSLAAIGEFMGR